MRDSIARKTPRRSRREGEEAERPRRRPPHFVAVDDRVDGDHRGGRHRDRTGDVEPSSRLSAGGREQDEREREDGDADGDVDEEDPVPVERVREDAAEEHPDRAAPRRDEAEDAHRLRPLGRLGEERDDERERHRRDDRPADSLHRPGRDQDALRACEAAGNRGQREERDPAEEHPPVPHDVTEPAAEEQEPAERQQVRVHDPRERLLREAEVLPDRGQRDPDDRHVEDDHQIAEAEHDQREPTGTGVGDGHRSGSFRGERRCRGFRRPRDPKLIARGIDEFPCHGRS